MLLPLQRQLQQMVWTMLLPLQRQLQLMVWITLLPRQLQLHLIWIGLLGLMMLINWIMDQGFAGNAKTDARTFVQMG